MGNTITNITNYASGHKAEVIASEWLKGKGYKIIELNWRTKSCEIDIVVKKKKTLYFVEVKHRKTDNYGSGLDYITPKKLKQMAYSAELYVSMNNHKGPYCLSAIELTGEDYAITNFIENVNL